MSASGAQNRRTHFRLPVMVRVDLRVAGNRAPIPATLIDISAGGCQLQGRTTVHADLACEFNLPRDHMPPLRVSGMLRKVTYHSSDKSFRYAVEFSHLSEAAREDLARFIHEEQRKVLALRRGEPVNPTPKPQRSDLRADRRVDVNIPVHYSVGMSGAAHEAIAIDVSTGGLRMLCDRVLRQEWEIVVRFTPPSEVLKLLQRRNGDGSMRPFQEVRLTAKALPGVKETRGKYQHSLVWVNPDPQATHEINRFVEAVRLISQNRR